MYKHFSVTLILVVVLTSLSFSSVTNVYAQETVKFFFKSLGYSRLKTVKTFGQPGDIVAESKSSIILLGNASDFIVSNEGNKSKLKVSWHYHTHLSFDIGADDVLAYIDDILPLNTFRRDLIEGHIVLDFTQLRSETVSVLDVNRMLSTGVDQSLLQALPYYKKTSLISETLTTRTIRLEFERRNILLRDQIFGGKTEYVGRDGARFTVKYISDDAIEITSDTKFVLGVKLVDIKKLIRSNNQPPTLQASLPKSNFVTHGEISLIKCRCKTCKRACTCCPRQKSDEDSAMVNTGVLDN
jgi:hypothetical protein